MNILSRFDDIIRHCLDTLGIGVGFHEIYPKKDLLELVIFHQGISGTIKWCTNGAQICFNIKVPTPHMGSEGDFRGVFSYIYMIGKRARAVKILIGEKVSTILLFPRLFRAIHHAFRLLPVWCGEQLSLVGHLSHETGYHLD